MSTFYRFTTAGRMLTLHRWREIGGCGVSDLETAQVCQHYQCAPKELDSKCLGELGECVPAIERMLARFAFTHLNRTDLAETAISPEQVQATIAAATAEVATWPPWKQNILEHSASPTSPRRPPVINE